MTAQPAPDRMTAAELREAFQKMTDELDATRDQMFTLRAEVETVQETLNKLLDLLAQAPKPAPTAAPGAEGLERVTVHTVSLTYDKAGQPIYHAMGGKYSRFGARIWPEILPLINVDPATLKPGPNPWPATVLVQPATGERAPKVMGLA